MIELNNLQHDSKWLILPILGMQIVIFEINWR